MRYKDKGVIQTNSLLMKTTMKTNIMAVTAAALCAAPMLQAGEPSIAEYTAPEPQTVAAPTETAVTSAPAAATCPLSVEIAASHMWAGGHILKNAGVDNAKVNTLGTDLTLVYGLTENHAATLRFGYAWGHGSARDFDETFLMKERYRLHNFSIMPGYRFTAPVTDTISCFVGANVGALNSSLKGAFVGSEYGEEEKVRFHDASWGLGYSAEVGMKVALTENVGVFLAYQFAGSTAKPKQHLGEDFKVLTKSQTYHGVRAGVSIDF